MVAGFSDSTVEAALLADIYDSPSSEEDCEMSLKAPGKANEKLITPHKNS